MKDLLQKYIAGDASESETRKVMEWLHENEQHLQEYKRLRKLYDVILWQANDVIANYQKNRYDHIILILMRVAAMITLILVSAYFYKQVHLSDKSRNWQTIMVSAGHQVELQLSDGTYVWLNAGTRFTFPGQFASNERRVILDGEGYFKVSPHAKQSFIVTTERYHVRVLGTEFNVLAYHTDSVCETSLLSGSVEILQKENEKSLLKLEPGSVVRLEKGELTTGKIQVADYFRWREGLICFDNASLLEILERLERCYGVEFIMDNSRLFDAHYTGKFRIKDGIDHVMRVLSLNHKFTYTINIENGTILIH